MLHTDIFKEASDMILAILSLPLIFWLVFFMVPHQIMIKMSVSRENDTDIYGIKY